MQGADRVIIGDFETLDQVEAALTNQSSPALHPDLFVIGMSAPERAAEDFARIRALRARLPAARWIVMSRSAGAEFWRDAVETRIDGMLHEDSPGEVLQLLAELVLLGYSFLPTGLATILAEGLQPPAEGSSLPPPSVGPTGLPTPEPEPRPGHPFRLSESPPASDTAHRWQGSLSERENDILRGLVAGHSNKLIARELQISEATVKVHVKALLRKMQVANRTQAAISALQFLRSSAHAAPMASTLSLAVPGSDAAPAASKPQAVYPVAERPVAERSSVMLAAIE